LEPGDVINIIAYIDAAYGVHADYRSYTGFVVGIGLGPVYASSCRQKTNTKSNRIGGLIQFWDWLFTSVEYKPKYLRGKASKHTGTYVNDS
jgi:hypothetical protein